MKRLLPHVLLAIALSLPGGCCMPGGLVSLQPGEWEGISALTATISDYAEETGDERARRIHGELAAALADGRFLRGDCEGQYVLGRTCDDLVCLDSDVAFDIDVLRRNAANCMLAMAILFHEGVHLDQDLSDFMFSDHEEDAYLNTHLMLTWLAAEIAARVAPITGVTFTPEAALEGLEATRVGMGEDYLAEICPAHIRRRRLLEFVKEHPEEDLAWIEIPPITYEARALPDGDFEVRVDLVPRLGEKGSRVTANFLRREHPDASPQWPSAGNLIETSKSVEFAMGWYAIRRGGEANLADDWNHSRVQPRAWRIENDQLVLVLPAPPGEAGVSYALALTLLLLPSFPEA